MKAITLIQPWATLIVIGHKRYETRSWRTRHRGQLLIHAGLKVDSAYLARPEVAALLGDRPVPTGCLVGVCNLLDCFPTEDVHGTIGDVERLVGDFVNGRYAWQLSDVREFREPIPCRGALGVWNAPPNMGTTLADLLYFPVVETATQSANGTAAAIDRVVHHSVIPEFEVPSYQTNAAQKRGRAEDVRR